MATSLVSVPDAPIGGRAAVPRSLEPAEVAWLAVLPCAALAATAILLLGPPLGDALFAPSDADRFWPSIYVHPEPVEHARFVLALAAAPLGAAVVLAGSRRPPRLRPGVTRALVLLAQAATVLFLALMLLAQHNVLLRSYVEPVRPVAVFSVRTIVAAVALALTAALALGRPGLLARLSGIARETRGRRAGCGLAAGLLTAAWLLAGFNTEETFATSAAHHLLPWDMAETFAVLDGRTPLLDFHCQYAQLLPYVAAGAARVVGTSIGAWTATMLVLSGLALVAVYAVLRRVVRGPVAALALYVPFLAGGASLFIGQITPLELFSLWPMRYGGPYLLLWLTARHLDGAAPRRCWLLLAAGGLVALNNLEFGVPAFAGALAAIAYADPPRSRGAAVRLLATGAVGLLAAVAVAAAVTLLHGGGLPRFSLLLEFPRIYGIGGWVMEPMAAAGLHLAVYGTFVGAVVVATVRAIRGEAHRLLTGMLVWSGIFGLGAGSYFAGRSDALNLISLFSAWSLALVLLTVVVVERAAARPGRRPSPSDLAVVLGFGLIACSVFQLPRPWAELKRLQATNAPLYRQAAAVRLVAGTTTPGQRVAILTQLGHRVAFDAGVVNVSPYAGMESMPTVGQLERTLEVVRRERVAQIYLDRRLTPTDVLDALGAAGFAPALQEDRFVLLYRPPGAGAR
jgi:hypothetical protein